MMNGRPRYCRPAIAMAALALMAVAMIPGPGAAHDRRVFPRDSSPYGNTYGEWSAQWWQWLLSIPTAKNPNLDTTGQDCDEGQTGPVWFLAGSFGGTFTRSCTVPAGKALLIPLVNALFGAGAFDCTPTVPNVLCDLNALRQAAAALVDANASPDSIKVEIDGVRIQDLSDFRVQSPVMSLTYPPDNVVSFLFGVPVPGGTYTPNVSDGYWLLFAPLSPGKHTIRVKSTGGFVSEVTYHLTIAK